VNVDLITIPPSVLLVVLGIVFSKKWWSWIALISPWLILGAGFLIKDDYTAFAINMVAMAFMWVAVASKFGWFRFRYHTSVHVRIGSVDVYHVSESDEKP
jgi:hypothetical protein